MTRSITYKILTNEQMMMRPSYDNYHGIEVHVDGQFKTQFTGFLDRDLLEALLRGEGTEVK